MARRKKKTIDLKDSGKKEKEKFIKSRGRKNFTSKIPDMTQVAPTRDQKRARRKFSDAVAYAQSVLRNPAKKAAYKVRRGETVYSRAIKDYLGGNIP